MSRLRAEWFPEFAKEFDNIDELYRKKRLIDEKTTQFICFSLVIKQCSTPGVQKHSKAASEAGARVKELAFILALVFRESVGNDDFGVHDVLGDYKELMKSNVYCCKK